MENITYLGLKDLKDEEANELKQLTEAYASKFERYLPKFKLKTSVKKSHVLGTVARFSINLSVESNQGNFYTEQNGWGLAKTAHRCGNHMHNMLEKHMQKGRQKK